MNSLILLAVRYVTGHKQVLGIDEMSFCITVRGKPYELNSIVHEILDQLVLHIWCPLSQFY
jgi:hypothetical protein